MTMFIMNFIFFKSPTLVAFYQTTLHLANFILSFYPFLYTEFNYSL